MKFCPSCGFNLKDPNSKFCMRSGFKFENTAPKPPSAETASAPKPPSAETASTDSEANCRQCGAAFDGNIDFCTNCGARRENSSEAAIAATRPASANNQTQSNMAQSNQTYNNKTQSSKTQQDGIAKSRHEEQARQPVQAAPRKIGGGLIITLVSLSIILVGVGFVVIFAFTNGIDRLPIVGQILSSSDNGDKENNPAEKIDVSASEDSDNTDIEESTETSNTSEASTTINEQSIISTSAEGQTETSGSIETQPSTPTTTVERTSTYVSALDQPTTTGYAGEQAAASPAADMDATSEPADEQDTASLLETEQAMTNELEIGQETYSALVTASMELYGYPAISILDSSNNTAWGYTINGNNISGSISIPYGTEITIYGIYLKNGYWKSQYDLIRNNRVKELLIEFDDGFIEAFTTSDSTLTDYSKLVDSNGEMLVFEQPHKTSNLKITILDLYYGASDMVCVTGISVILSPAADSSEQSETNGQMEPIEPIELTTTDSIIEVATTTAAVVAPTTAAPPPTEAATTTHATTTAATTTAAAVTILKQDYLNSLNHAYSKESNIHSASSASERLALIEEAHTAWDVELNRIYGLLRDKLPSDEFNLLRTDELAWIRYRDNEVSREGEKWTDPTDRHSEMTYRNMELTKLRTYELIDYYYDGVFTRRFSS